MLLEVGELVAGLAHQLLQLGQTASKKWPSSVYAHQATWWGRTRPWLAPRAGRHAPEPVVRVRVVLFKQLVCLVHGLRGAEWQAGVAGGLGAASPAASPHAPFAAGSWLRRRAQRWCHCCPARAGTRPSPRCGSGTASGGSVRALVTAHPALAHPCPRPPAHSPACPLAGAPAAASRSGAWQCL